MQFRMNEYGGAREILYQAEKAVNCDPGGTPAGEKL